MDRCSFPDCNRKVKARGLCETHYMRWRRGADIEAPRTHEPVRPVGFRRVRKDGYVTIKVEGWSERNDPLEHRVVAEQMLGRPLTSDEHVHHLNEDRADNRPENLIVMSNADHQRMHDHLDVQHAPRKITLVCQHCGALYQQKPSREFTSKFCSNACRLIVLHQWRDRKK